MSRGEAADAAVAAATAGGGGGKCGWSREGGRPPTILGDGSCGEMISLPPDRRMEIGETVALDVAPRSR